MLSDDQDTGTNYFDDDEDSPSRQLGSLVSKASPASLVAMTSPPPDIAPPTQTSTSTPRTGSLATAPSQAVPKNRDTGTGYNTGVSNPPDGGNVSSVLSPAAVQPASGLRPAQSAASLMPAGNGLQPASTASSLLPADPNVIRPDGRRAVIRDLNGRPAGSPGSTLLPAGSLSSQGATSDQGLQPAVSPAPYRPGVPLATQQAQRVQAYNAGPGPGQYAASQTLPATDPTNPDPNASLRPGGSGAAPLLPAAASQQMNGPSQLDTDQSRLNYLKNSGSGIDQIQNPIGRGFARSGDIALKILAPNIEPLVPGTQGHNQLLIGQQQQRVGNDQAQQQATATLANTRSQMAERDAMGRRYDAQANYYNPEPLSAGQAQVLGHPEWEGLKLDARDAERLVGGAARNQTTLQAHFGGQQRNLSAEDAAAINTPSLEGASMSNDEYQRLLQGAQHNQQLDTNNQRTTGQSDTNNRRNNATRITTTGMRDATSEENSDRAHPGGGATKPIPAGIRDRIESQKNTAINKARAAFDNGESTQDDYLDNWQSAQNDYEDRLSAQTGGPIPHTDIRSNVDAKGNWIGNRGTAQPQSARPPGFVTQKGNKVALGDPVNVNGRRGTVTGFNARTGKAQVKWASGN